MERQKKINILSRAALFAAALIWGSSFFVVKDTVNTIPPNFLLAVRFTIGCLALALIFRKRLKKLNKEYIWQGAVIGLCLFAAYSSQTIGITDTTPGKNAFLTAVYCVIVPFLFWIVNKTRPDIYNMAAAALCLTGIGLVSLTEGFSIRMGDALTLLGGFFYALHIVMVAKLAKDKDPVLISKKEKEGPTPKNKSKLSDIPISHFSSIGISILCVLMSALRLLEVFVSLIPRSTYSREKSKAIP